MNRLVIDRKFWLIPIVLWTVIAGASFLWNWRNLDHHAKDMAHERARLVAQIVQSMRAWDALHGTATISPEKIQAAPLGKPHPLLDSACIDPQLGASIATATGIHIRLTSLHLVSPANRPDRWEAAALEAFENGERERFEFAYQSGVNDRPATRYIAALFVEERCLRCHRQQGYKAGDIRGGLSVRFDSGPLAPALVRQRYAVAAGHIGGWLFLSAFTLLVLRRTREHMLLLQQARAEQVNLVAQRTAELEREVYEHEKTEEKLRLIIQFSGEGIFGLDADGRCTFCNPVALQLLGYKRPMELLGRNLEALLTEPDTHPLASSFRQGQLLHNDSLTFRRADGGAVPVEFRAHPIVVDDRVQGAVVTFSDITERKRNEETLRTLSSAVEHSPDSVMITDKNGIIEYVNPKFLEVTGFSYDEVKGQKAGFNRSGQIPLATYQQLWSTINAGGIWTGEFHNRKKSGELFWEEVSISPILDKRGHITHFVSVREDVTARKALEQKIWHQANFDALTDLPNRALFHDRLQQALTHADRYQHQVAVFFIDLDHFKEVNDTLGHEAGDQLLIAAADRLRNCVRKSDTVARLGGDEFTVILTELVNKDNIAALAQKVIQQLSKPFTVMDRSVVISASIGIGRYPLDADNIADLLKKADAAMYQAKGRGRKGFCFSSDN